MRRYLPFLSSPLAVKRYIAVTIVLRCTMYVRACVHPPRFARAITPYIYAWISKLFDIIVVLEEEKCHLKHFSGRLKVKVTPEGHIN